MTDQIVTQNNPVEPAFNAGQVASMSSREIADLTGKRHDHVMVDIRKMFEGLNLHAPDFSGAYSTGQGNEYECFNLPKRETLILVSGYSVKLRAKIIDRWQELEQAAAPALPMTYADALRLYADEVEKAEQLAIERDHAVATKAQIGSNREATAMATASAASRKAKRLEVELDQSMQYASIKRMEMLYHGQKFNWRHLKSTGVEMSIEPIDIFDANYSTVKAYHADVWCEAYALDIDVREAV